MLPSLNQQRVPLDFQMNNIITMAQKTCIKFKSGNGWCDGDLHIPDGHESSPLIIMAHGLGAVKSMRLSAYAERFVRAGYACMIFDYRHFGASDGVPRQLLDIKLQLEDWRAAINYASDRKEFDINKIILWGTSFSGGHVLTIAAELPKLAAVISQCPFTSGLGSSMNMDVKTSISLAILALYDRARMLVGASPAYIPITASPNHLALMNAKDALDGYQSLKPAGVNIPNYVCARIALGIMFYSPGRSTKKIESPVLFCICDNDSVAPTKKTVKFALNTPNKSIKIYSYGHFEIYLGTAFERLVSDQLDFLYKNVPPGKQLNIQ
ncbi:alpha/beta hydrolase [Pseudomonas sp. BGM005]|nr:alpha/beta hydrolase [Pseudomonas sp. BG5]